MRAQLRRLGEGGKLPAGSGKFREAPGRRIRSLVRSAARSLIRQHLPRSHEAEISRGLRADLSCLGWRPPKTPREPSSEPGEAPGSGRLRETSSGCGWPISYCLVQAVYQRPGSRPFAGCAEAGNKPLSARLLKRPSALIKRPLAFIKRPCVIKLPFALIKSQSLGKMAIGFDKAAVAGNGR